MRQGDDDATLLMKSPANHVDKLETISQDPRDRQGADGNNDQGIYQGEFPLQPLQTKALFLSGWRTITSST